MVHVSIEGSSDATPTPDLASLMLAAVSLGATHSHVSQTKRAEYTRGIDEMPTVTTSTCVSFTFYSSNMLAPHVNGTLYRMSRPSSPISISTDGGSDNRPASPVSITNTDLPGTASEIDFTIVEDPCVSFKLVPASTIPTGPAPVLPSDDIFRSHSSAGAPTAPANHHVAAATTPAQAATHHDRSATIVTPPDILPAGIATAATLNMGLPVSDERWYCVTVGRQVGVFQGVQNVLHLVNGISGACYPRHSSEASALAAFNQALMDNQVQVKI